MKAVLKRRERSGKISFAMGMGTTMMQLLLEKMDPGTEKLQL